VKNIPFIYQHFAAREPPHRLRGLLAEMGKGVSHWGAGNVDHPVEWLVEFQDQEDRARH